MSWNGNDLFNSTLMGGMPSGSDPHQYLTTDGDGKPRWEPRLAYEESAVVEIMPTTDVGVIWYSQKTIACPYEGKVKIGDTGSFILDGVPHDYVAIEDIGNPPAEMTLDVDGVSNYVKLSSGKNMILYNIGMHPTQSHTIALTVNSKITKTIDPKYLPSGSGGGFVVNATLTPTDDTGMTGTVTFDKTFEETLAAVKAGKYVACHFVLPGEDETKNVVANTSYNESHLGFVVQLGTIGVQIVMHVGGEHQYLFTSD